MSNVAETIVFVTTKRLAETITFFDTSGFKRTVLFTKTITFFETVTFFETIVRAGTGGFGQTAPFPETVDFPETASFTQTVPFSQTRPSADTSAFQSASMINPDQVISNIIPPIGLIVGVVIGATAVLFGSTVALVLVRKRRKAQQSSEEDSPATDAHFLDDSRTSTIDASLMNFRVTDTYDNIPSTIDTVDRFSVPGSLQNVLTHSLL
jgi:hypothetical protein